MEYQHPRRPSVFVSNARQSILLFDAPQIAFLCLAIATAASAVDFRSARVTVYSLALWATAGLVIGHLGQSRTLSRWVCWAAVSAATALSLYFVTQFSYLAVPDKVHALDAAGRFVSDLAPRLTWWAPFSNSLATLLEGVLPLAVGAALDARTAPGRSLLAVEAVLVGFACALTMSRGAWLGLAVAGIVWTVVALSPRSKRPAIVTLVLLALVGVGLAMTWEAALHALSRAAALGGSTFARPDRLEIYRKSISLVSDVGLIGLGPGDQFATAFSKFALVIQVPFVTYPHQLTFHLWLAYGVAGIVVWAWWWSGVAAVAAVAEGQRVSRTFRGAWCGLVVVLVHGLSDARQAVDPWTWGPLFVLTGLIAARHRRAGRPLPFAGLVVPGAVAAVVLVIGLVRLWPLDAAWHTNQGLLQEAEAQAESDQTARVRLIESAERHYEQAIVADPHRAGPRRRLAMLAADHGDFAAAFDHGVVALQSDPGSFTTRKVAGLVAAWAGHLELAYNLLEGIDGIGNEMQVWASSWSARGQSGASENSALLASQLAPSR